MTVLSHLRAVRDLLSDPSRFTTGSMARDGDGEIVHPLSSNAVRWCLVGACRRTDPDKRHYGADAFQPIWRKLGQASVSQWSDRNGHAAVLKLLDEVIADEETKR